MEVKSYEEQSSFSIIQGASEKFGEWSQKIKETRVTNKLLLLAFKVITISYNTQLTSVVKLLETVSNLFLWNLSKDRDHALFHIFNICEA